MLFCQGSLTLSGAPESGSSCGECTVLPKDTQLAHGVVINPGSCTLQETQHLLLLHHGHPDGVVHMELAAAQVSLLDFQLHSTTPLSHHHIPLRFVVDFQETGGKNFPSGLRGRHMSDQLCLDEQMNLLEYSGKLWVGTR